MLPRAPSASELQHQKRLTEAYYKDQEKELFPFIESGHQRIMNDGTVLIWNPAEGCYDKDFTYHYTRQNANPSWEITDEMVDRVTKNQREKEFLKSNYYKNMLVSKEHIEIASREDCFALADDGRKEHSLHRVNHPFNDIPDKDIDSCLDDIFVRQNYRYT
ncbi:unnamed protein product [Bursaphelenchus okinawaensis]|uniref:Uncharacterized protein n=1 Tax=Bursaphelenchus okinawaensis TaxID=465554 RepID=A0A811KSK2_9BILA|nr:unnamed protein product [Bursaphelenchus okinawaensis]CAG9110497.1 unnamed protein product [Bursaphelenchus okinawaensis]